MPEVSIITGAYNIANCFSFSKSMESILKQTYTDFEFILCDDGSTDQTWTLLNAYAAGDKRIKLLQNKQNQGLAASLNRCIAVSTGTFIARHDCDDYCDLTRLEKQVDYLKKHPDVAILGCQVYLFDENGVWGQAFRPIQVTKEDFLFTSPYYHGSVMFRRDALLKAGTYRVAKETYRTEDYDLFMTMQSFCRGENLPEHLYYFCEDSNAKRRRKYRYRLDEAKIRWRGFRRLGLLPKGLPYVIKPLVVGLMPTPLLESLKNRYLQRKTTLPKSPK